MGIDGAEHCFVSASVSADGDFGVSAAGDDACADCAASASGLRWAGERGDMHGDPFRTEHDAFRLLGRGAEGGKLYGSVTAQEIADELFKQYGVKVEKRRIDVANIRNAGDFTVSVWLYAGITAEMTAKVEIG